MVLGRVGPHDQDDVSVLDVDPVVRHCTASKRLCQSRYSCAVSDARLVFDVHQAQGPEKFLVQVALFVVHGGAADRGHAHGPVDDGGHFLLHLDATSLFLDLDLAGGDKAGITALFYPYRYLVDGPVPAHLLPFTGTGSPVHGLRTTLAGLSRS